MTNKPQVISMTYKIQLKNGEFYANKSKRVQHFKTEEKAKAKITKEKLNGAKVVESGTKNDKSSKK